MGRFWGRKKSDYGQENDMKQAGSSLARLVLLRQSFHPFLYDVDAFFIIDGIVRWIDLAKLL